MPNRFARRRFRTSRGEATLAFKRPGGGLVVRRRRTAVEPSGGCLLGFPIWLYTRLRWQLGSPRTWSVEVWAPGRFRSVQTRKVHVVEAADRSEAVAVGERLAADVEAGAFDHHLEGSSPE